MFDAAHLNLLRLFQQAPGFVCFLRGPDLVFELANEAYFQLVGHRDIVGKPLRDALPEVAGQGFIELLERVYRTGEPFVGRSMFIQLQRKPGAALVDAYVDFIYQPILGEDGAVEGILAQGSDVTDLKRLATENRAADDARRLADDRYRALFESIDDGYCLMQMIVDADGKTVDYRFLETNNAFEAQTGLRAARGRTARELVPNLDESWFRLYGAVAETGKAARFENHAPAMNRWFEVHAQRVGVVEQRLVALVFKDISERKLAEQERETLLAAESEARRMAEDASRVKDEFLATISHELRTPLHSMLGWLTLLRQGNLTADKRERALETIERNAHSQAKLVDDLLDLSAVLAGKLRLEVQTVDLRSAIEAAVDVNRPAADAKGIRVQATLSSRCEVMGDASRLQQVFWNLLSNAIKFTPKGGRVQILLEATDSSAVVTVADTGAGISPEFLPHVFEAFRQAEGGRTRSSGGLGLGLSIVSKLVELHGGTVSVSSEGLGHGAIFVVSIPVAVVKRRISRPPHTASTSLRTNGFECPPELAGLSVVAVDDDADARELLRSTLETCGLRVRVAASAEECLRLILDDPPDVLLSDVGMPGEDGYSLIRRVRALPSEQGGDVPAVALTAYARATDRTHALLSGFTSHLPKPVDPSELIAVVASMARRTPEPRH